MQSKRGWLVKLLAPGSIMLPLASAPEGLCHPTSLPTCLQFPPAFRYSLAAAAHMANSYYWQCYLQQPSNEEVTDFILEQFELLHETYMHHRVLIPPGGTRPAPAQLGTPHWEAREGPPSIACCTGELLPFFTEICPDR